LGQGPFAISGCTGCCFDPAHALRSFSSSYLRTSPPPPEVPGFQLPTMAAWPPLSCMIRHPLLDLIPAPASSSRGDVRYVSYVAVGPPNAVLGSKRAKTELRTCTFLSESGTFGIGRKTRCKYTYWPCCPRQPKSAGAGTNLAYFLRPFQLLPFSSTESLGLGIATRIQTDDLIQKLVYWKGLVE
jgi:hypothetical protein